MKVVMLLSGLFVVMQTKAIVIQSPFDRTMDLTSIEKVLEGSPDELVATIKSQGIAIYLFPKTNMKAQTPVADFLKNLTRLSLEQYKKFGPTYYQLFLDLL